MRFHPWLRGQWVWRSGEHSCVNASQSMARYIAPNYVCLRNTRAEKKHPGKKQIKEREGQSKFDLIVGTNSQFPKIAVCHAKGHLIRTQSKLSAVSLQ
jgi:hypothetical protein